MPVWRNWQTRTTQNRVPSGVPVRPRPLVSKRKKTLYTLYGVFFYAQVASSYHPLSNTCSFLAGVVCGRQNCSTGLFGYLAFRKPSIVLITEKTIKTMIVIEISHVSRCSIPVLYFVNSGVKRLGVSNMIEKIRVEVHS